MKRCVVLVAVLACRTHEPPQIAFLLSAPHARELSYFEDRAHELGVSTVALAADDDAATQRAQVEDALGRGAKVLVIQPTNSATAAPYVRLAHEHRVPVVAYGRAIDSPELDYYVAHDSYRVGVLQAQAALEATGHKGRYVILAGAAATEITRGYKDTLAPYIASGDVQIVLESSAEPAQLGGQLDAILASDASLARAAVKAAAGLPHVFIAGAGADPANVNLVCQGKQTIDVLEDIQPLAKAAADVAKQLLDGAPPKAPATIALAGKPVPVAAVRVEVITPDNVKPLLVDTGFLAASEIPACAKKLAQAR
jgi:ABC-type xylose transport system substrate-binding protein